MFTGIITDVGTIEAIERRGDLRARISTVFDTTTIDLGASIACSGVCLTVVDKGPGWFAVDISAESIARSAEGMWSAGTPLNLERALKVGDELGGHIVSGHVDGVGDVVDVQMEGDSHRVLFAAPRALAPYIAPKGSIAIDGVSLTVNLVEDEEARVLFSINLIPHTVAMTSFAGIAPGRRVNIEIDTLARYLGRMEQLRHVR
ncbi:riboflavin synthase [Flavisphingomonas formosensis]|uniref:riboflavin synthase n=1 Tax=Flavisphingomonas formosensis TaxID=861534 RepID=UPI0012FC6458|nr:riboflavin synthase [Sphingomonas formosensis]